MTLRPVVRRTTVIGLIAVLLGSGAQPVATGDLAARASPDGLKPCPVAALPSTRRPTAPPRLDDPTACRARPSQVVAAGALPYPQPGYHHLGATTIGAWAGVQGRLTVRDPGVRPGTNDFVATRFMAKRESAGKVSWLEAGWAETGWSGGGRQRVYTFDTSRNAWTFYDQYRLADGDQVWIDLRADSSAASPLWRAWVWWGNAWQLLIAEALPLTGAAQLEQYVEVYLDPKLGDTPLPVPRIAIDNVQVEAQPGGAMRYWREADVPTAPGTGTAAYCLDWQTRFDTWSAGNC
jgi:hypothetical protein